MIAFMPAPAPLLSIPAFAALTPEELAALTHGARDTRLPAGVQVMGKGEPGSSMMVLIEGRLRVSAVSLEGRALTFRLVEPVEVVGEIAALDGRPRSADVTTVTPARLLVIPREACLAAVRTHPGVAKALLVLLCTRLRETTNGLERLAMQRLPARMAHLLLRLAADYGRPAPQGGITLPMRLSQAEIGTLVHATREAVNKQLSQWRDEAVLEVRGGQIVLTRPQALVALLE
jgi:CRP-like cAMP-binding protein